MCVGSDVKTHSLEVELDWGDSWYLSDDDCKETKLPWTSEQNEQELIDKDGCVWSNGRFY